MAFRKAALADDLWCGEKIGVTLNGTRVLLVHVEDAIHAYEDRCLHKGVCLSEGRLEGTRLTCFAHHWQYDVLTGCGINPGGIALRRFPVRIEAGAILVDVDPIGEAER